MNEVEWEPIIQRAIRGQYDLGISFGQRETFQQATRQLFEKNNGASIARPLVFLDNQLQFDMVQFRDRQNGKILSTVRLGESL